jgi:hypothetical protein
MRPKKKPATTNTNKTVSGRRVAMSSGGGGVYSVTTGVGGEGRCAGADSGGVVLPSNHRLGDDVTLEILKKVRAKHIFIFVTSVPCCIRMQHANLGKHSVSAGDVATGHSGGIRSCWGRVESGSGLFPQPSNTCCLDHRNLEKRSLVRSSEHHVVSVPGAGL